MFIIKYRKFFIGFSILMMVLAAAVTTKFGLNLGIDFTGGSILEVSYEDQRPDIVVVREAVAKAGFAGARVQPFGDLNVIVRTPELTEEEHQQLLTALQLDVEQVTEERYNTIGPTIGNELRAKALIAIVVVALAIILFVAYAFRRVSRPISSWTYGLTAVIALIHDVIIPVGVFALLGREIDTLFVVGVLSILGLSVNDTIVVFDRIRENVREKFKGGEANQAGFEKLVGLSLKQTMARSVNTSLTLLVVLVVLMAVGPVATRELALVLLLGTVTGTYSSIFFASPLLIAFSSRKVAKK